MSTNNATAPQTEQALFDIANSAAEQFSQFDLAHVKKIVQAVQAAAQERSEHYAQWAVSESGMGDVASKKMKNDLNTLVADGDIAAYVQPRVEKDKNIITFPKPAGVVVALVPCTNPVATIYFKVLCCLMTRNAVILCPHPKAKKCSYDAAQYLMSVAERMGAPKGAIQCLQEPDVKLVNQLMKSSDCKLTLATGGPAMVRAAYSSGNPAIGVGPGNPVAYVHESADVAHAAECLIASVSFDNCLLCTSESMVLADKAIAGELKTQLVTKGAAFIESPDEARRLRDFLFPNNTINAKAIGQSALWLAEQCGFNVPDTTKILVTEVHIIGPEEVMAKEKMFPAIGFMTIDGVEHATRSMQSQLAITGVGHSAVIHSNDYDVIAKIGGSLPVCRIAVNVGGATGSTGFESHVDQGAVIGTGYFGRSSVHENVGPKHLIQWTQMAFHAEKAFSAHDAQNALTLYEKNQSTRIQSTIATTSSQVISQVKSQPVSNINSDKLRELIRSLLKQELKQLLGK